MGLSSIGWSVSFSGGRDMRLVFALLALLVATSVVEARPRKTTSKNRERREQREQRDEETSRERLPDVAVRDDSQDEDFDRAREKQRRRKNRELDWGKPQSFGVAWNGYLRNGVQLQLGDGAFIRRPYRSYGTRSTV